jgi:probable HAF family extracellular repeat protein
MRRDAIKLAIATVLVGAGGLAEAQGYRFTPLPFPGGASLTASAHNNREQAVGSAYDKNGVMQAVVWKKGIPSALQGLGSSSQALAINRHGQVVGYAFDPSFGQRAVLWDEGNLMILEAPEGAMTTTAVAINGRGEVAGNSGPFFGSAHAIKWVGGKPALLDSLGGTSVAEGINSAGDVVGYVDGPSGFGARRPVVWHGNVVTVLDPLRETECCNQASAISDSGEIVGWSSSSYAGTLRAVVWNGTRPTALQALSDADEALGVNDQHQAVGMLNAGGVTRAALWNLITGEGVDLNAFLTAAQKAQGWVLSSANGINRRGAIVGTLFNENTGSFSAFQLVPMSQP